MSIAFNPILVMGLVSVLVGYTLGFFLRGGSGGSARLKYMKREDRFIAPRKISYDHLEAAIPTLVDQLRADAKSGEFYPDVILGVVPEGRFLAGLIARYFKDSEYADIFVSEAASGRLLVQMNIENLHTKRELSGNVLIVDEWGPSDVHVAIMDYLQTSFPNLNIRIAVLAEINFQRGTPVKTGVIDYAAFLSNNDKIKMPWELS